MGIMSVIRHQDNITYSTPGVCPKGHLGQRVHPSQGTIIRYGSFRDAKQPIVLVVGLEEETRISRGKL